MTATVAGKPPRKRPTAAEKIAAAEAEAAELRRQLAAHTVAGAAPLPPSAMPANGSNGHKAAAIPEMLRFTTDDGDDGQPEVRVPVFSVDGTVYTMPAKPGPAIGLRATHMMGDRTVSPTVAEARATDYVLTAMLGAEAHAALLALPKITRAQLRQVISIVTATAFGALEDDPKDT